MTPLLRWGKALLKLEYLRHVEPAAIAGPIAASGNHALLVARPGLAVALRGAVTHEMRKTLEIWGVRFVEKGEPFEPEPVFAAELSADLGVPLVVAPADDLRALLAAAARLKARPVALVAADEELPDLPRSAQLPADVERVVVRRSEASAARRELAGTMGLLATHAGAAAAALARERGGLALLMAPGEREFSIESAA